MQRLDILQSILRQFIIMFLLLIDKNNTDFS